MAKTASKANWEKYHCEPGIRNFGIKSRSCALHWSRGVRAIIANSKFVTNKANNILLNLFTNENFRKTKYIGRVRVVC